MTKPESENSSVANERISLSLHYLKKEEDGTQKAREELVSYCLHSDYEFLKVKPDNNRDQKRIRLRALKKKAKELSAPEVNYSKVPKFDTEHFNILGYRIALEYEVDSFVDHTEKTTVQRPTELPLIIPAVLAECRKATFNLVGVLISITVFSIIFSEMGAGSQNNPLLVVSFTEHSPYLLIALSFVLLVQVVRIFFGINFLDFDKSFASHVDIIASKNKIKFDRIARLVLIVTLALLPVLFSRDLHTWTLLMISILALLPMIYLVVFREELTSESGADYVGNILLMAADGSFYVLTLMYLFSIWGFNSIIHVAQGLMAAFFFIIFALEAAITYGKSIKRSLRLAWMYLTDNKLT